MEAAEKSLQGVLPPKGWEGGDDNYRWFAEWGDLERWTQSLEREVKALEVELSEAEGLRRAEIITRLLCNNWNLEQYGSSKARPTYHMANFFGGRLDAASVGARMEGVEIPEGVNEKGKAERFLIDQPNENFEAVYKRLFTGKGVRGWMTNDEKGLVLGIIRASISDDEKARFRSQWSSLGDEDFGDVWSSRKAMIERWIGQFERQAVPEKRPRLGHKGIRKILDLLSIEANIKDVQRITKVLAEGVLAGESTETKDKQLLDKQKYDEVIDKTIEDFIRWCKEMSLPANQIEALRAWQQRSRNKKIGMWPDLAALNASTAWTDQVMKLKSFAFWNQEKDPEGTLRLVVWHEMAHVLQMLGIGIKADENSSLSMETHGVLAEFAMAAKYPELVPALFELLRKRAISFNVGVRMQGRGKEQDWRNFLVDVEGSKDKVLSSLTIGPLALQQYWLAVLYLGAKLGDQSEGNVKSMVEQLFKKMGAGKTLEFGEFVPPIEVEEFRRRMESFLNSMKYSGEIDQES